MTVPVVENEILPLTAMADVSHHDGCHVFHGRRILMENSTGCHRLPEFGTSFVLVTPPTQHNQGIIIFEMLPGIGEP